MIYQVPYSGNTRINGRVLYISLALDADSVTRCFFWRDHCSYHEDAVPRYVSCSNYSSPAPCSVVGDVDGRGRSARKQLPS
jgi:hypothetical protein